MYCSLCNVSCPSSYQYEQHINGKKHKQRFIKQGGGGCAAKHGSGVCFYYQQGRCYKGDACTYLHTDAGVDESVSSVATSFEERYQHSASDSAKRKSEDHSVVAEILLCKGETEAFSPSAEKENGLAPLFCKPVAKKKEKVRTFPAEFRNAFHRKRDVNLYIQGGQVVWEFAYNPLAIRAIKEHIKGRAWNPNLGVKGCWTCPLESLPDAIALYEFMGRTIDESMKKRAKEIQESFGSASASDAIKLSIQLALKGQEAANATNSIGSVVISFLYDADVVAALKMLSPVLRTYDPTSKSWTIDILALPELLEHLEPLEYKPSAHLVEVANACSVLQNVLWNEESPTEGSQSDPVDIESSEPTRLLKRHRQGREYRVCVESVDYSRCKAR